jgi:hypothetical protein
MFRSAPGARQDVGDVKDISMVALTTSVELEIGFGRGHGKIEGQSRQHSFSVKKNANPLIKN